MKNHVTQVKLIVANNVGVMEISIEIYYNIKLLTPETIAWLNTNLIEFQYAIWITNYSFSI